MKYIAFVVGEADHSGFLTANPFALGSLLDEALRINQDEAERLESFSKDYGVLLSGELHIAEETKITQTTKRDVAKKIIVHIRSIEDEATKIKAVQDLAKKFNSYSRFDKDQIIINSETVNTDQVISWIHRKLFNPLFKRELISFFNMTFNETLIRTDDHYYLITE